MNDLEENQVEGRPAWSPFSWLPASWAPEKAPPLVGNRLGFLRGGVTGLLGGAHRDASLFADAGQLLAVRSVGDTLRRGRSRDALAQRLDLDVVGPGRLVLVEARTRLLDASARDGHLRRQLPPRDDARR